MDRWAFGKGGLVVNQQAYLLSALVDSYSLSYEYTGRIASGKGNENGIAEFDGNCGVTFSSSTEWWVAFYLN